MYIPEIPDNSLKSQLTELVSFVGQIETIQDEEEHLSTIFRFNPPATDDEIECLEALINAPLPEGYKDFLKFSNGAQLAGFTAEFYDIRYTSMCSKCEKAPDFPKDYIMVADIIGDGEVLCFSKDTGKFIRIFGKEHTEYDNFYEFFNWLIRFVKMKLEDYIDF